MKHEDLGFTYQVRKSGEVVVFHEGRLASTLRGREASDFLQKAEGATAEDVQQLMARVTGNYRRGNERQAGKHPRNA